MSFALYETVHHGGFLFIISFSFLVTVNGRFSAKNDHYTCTSSQSTSVVDYILTSPDSFNLFKDFEVKTCESIISEHNLFKLISDSSKIPDHSL